MAPTQHPALWPILAIRAAKEHHTRVPLIQGVASGLVALAFVICTLRLIIRLKRRTTSYEDGFIAVAMVCLCTLGSESCTNAHSQAFLGPRKHSGMFGYADDHCNIIEIFSDFFKRQPMVTEPLCRLSPIDSCRKLLWYQISALTHSIVSLTLSVVLVGPSHVQAHHLAY